MARRLIYGMDGMVCPGCGNNLSETINLLPHHNTPEKDCPSCPHVDDPIEETVHDSKQFHQDEARHIRALRYRNADGATPPGTRHVRAYEEGGHVYCSMACTGHEHCDPLTCPDTVKIKLSEATANAS